MNTAGIVQVPHPILRIQCAPVTDFEDMAFKRFAGELVAAAGRYGRKGVAAPQIGLTARMFAMSISKSAPILFVNPSITGSSGTQIGNEGCLSVAERWFYLERADVVKVEYQDINGNSRVLLKAEGLDARAIQHEMDHLDGRLVTDVAREQMVTRPRQQRRAIERELAKVPA